jgi:hypothetical protein
MNIWNVSRVAAYVVPFIRWKMSFVSNMYFSR